MSINHVDIDFLLKYSKPGPRYTSYPTVPNFNDNFSPEDAHAAVVQSNTNNSDSPLSLYFHIPFCEHKCVYCGCNTIITRSSQKVETYINNLKREINLVAKDIDQKRQVVQMHFGGGTPTYLEPEQLMDIVNAIKSAFNFDKAAEISIEIDPRTLKEGYLEVLRKNGFNRLSFGVQDLDPEVQKEIARSVLEDNLRQLISEAKRLEFDSVNYDLIYGLPLQTEKSFQDTIEKVVSLNPDRLAVYNFAYLPDTIKNQRKIDPATLPSTDARLKMLKYAIEELQHKGFEYIGMDHFAKPDDELTLAMYEGSLHRNFQGYTTKAGTEVYAFGVTSISQLDNHFFQNTKSLVQYASNLDQGKMPVIKGYALDRDDSIRKSLITKIMCNNFIDKRKFEDKFSINFDEYFKREMNSMDEFIKDDLVELHDDFIKITDLGRFAVRNIAMLFDEFLYGKSNKQIEYSKTV